MQMKRTASVLVLTALLWCGAAVADSDTGGHSSMSKHYENSIFKITEDGRFSLEVLLPDTGPELGVNKVDIIVHDNRDKDVTGATLTVTPWMPEMDHGVKEKPIVSERGGGLYTLSNVVFSMTGKWELRVQVTDGQTTDRAVITLPMVGAMGHTHAMDAPDPDMIDLATEKTSRDGKFHVSYESDVTPVPVNRIHSWTLTVRTGKDDPVEGAKIFIAGDMPEHGHGFPTEPEVTRYLGEGKYKIEGLKFSMPGWWVVDFHIRSGETMDHAGFNIIVK